MITTCCGCNLDAVLSTSLIWHFFRHWISTEGRVGTECDAWSGLQRFTLLSEDRWSAKLARGEFGQVNFIQNELLLNNKLLLCCAPRPVP